MNLPDLQAMLAEIARDPAGVVICFFLVFVAGLVAGNLARQRDAEWPEVGDTQAPLNWGTRPSNQVPPYHPPIQSVPTPAHAAELRRVRAGTTLKPSYDSRRQSTEVPHHPV